MTSARIDGQWFADSLVRQHTAHWLAVAPQPNGFYRNAFDRQWRAAEKQEATLVSQNRLMYVFSCGYRVTGDEAYLDAARAGADFLLRHFRDDRFGGWYWSVGPDGAVLRDAKQAYGHAFVIWGLAHAYALTGDVRYRRACQHTWETLDQKMRDPMGGIILHAERNFKDPSPVRNQNHMMHLFESLTALYEATGERTWFDSAAEIATFLFNRLYRECEGHGDGLLAEDGDAQWRPKPDEDGGRVNIGHQFEWAFLLSRGVGHGLPEWFLSIGQKLLNFGLRVGWVDSGAINTWCDSQGRVKPGSLGWWEQTECLRAMLHYAASRKRDDLWPYCEKAQAFIRDVFYDAEFGGCYELVAPAPPHRVLRDTKGHVYKAGYHVAAMHMEALRLSGRIGELQPPEPA